MSNLYSSLHGDDHEFSCSDSSVFSMMQHSLSSKHNNLLHGSSTLLKKNKKTRQRQRLAALNQKHFQHPDSSEIPIHHHSVPTKSGVHPLPLALIQSHTYLRPPRLSSSSSSGSSSSSSSSSTLGIVANTISFSPRTPISPRVIGTTRSPRTNIIPVQSQSKSQSIATPRLSKSTPVPAPALDPAPGSTTPLPSTHTSTRIEQSPSESQLAQELYHAQALLRWNFKAPKALHRLRHRVEDLQKFLQRFRTFAVTQQVLEGQVFQECLVALSTFPAIDNKGLDHGQEWGPEEIPQPQQPQRVIRSRSSCHRSTASSPSTLTTQNPKALAPFLPQVQQLVELLRVKIEDDNDLKLARQALKETSQMLEHCAAYATEHRLGEDQVIQLVLQEE